MVLLEWTGAVVLTTPRLVLRAFRRDDLPHYAELNADLEVMRYLGGVLTRESSDQMAVWAQERHAREGTGLLAIERRADGAFLGMCGLHVLRDWYPDDIEIGWRLARAMPRKPPRRGSNTAFLHSAWRESSRSRTRPTRGVWRSCTAWAWSWTTTRTSSMKGKRSAR